MTWQWDDVRFFLAVARTGSLSSAARALGVGHVTVGRRITALERRLGVTLLNRTPDGFATTSAGDAILRQCAAMESAAVFGSIDKPGPYAILVRWHPGFMSAPHTYVTDRLCFVLSGTWWVNSGQNFEPEKTVPVPAGGFVRRVAHTPHYDGVRKGGNEPAVIGIFGQAPIEFKLVDPTKPRVRAV